ncbi:uncharacterized protein LOC111635471 isoform X3 [Centruroides sculpturatus]|uniref:uncharacterized protein LOC111635471 isoform X3 n=1 Tax=Centruroides sculpturatus TaxID=218467 RepID=UPI000C6D51C6|nr:uncharacterized protein LOC111635471 isoform X3 [Centruroides sculpturatus]
MEDIYLLSCRAMIDIKNEQQPDGQDKVTASRSGDPRFWRILSGETPEFYGDGISEYGANLSSPNVCLAKPKMGMLKKDDISFIGQSKSNRSKQSGGTESCVILDN